MNTFHDSSPRGLIIKLYQRQLEVWVNMFGQLTKLYSLSKTLKANLDRERCNAALPPFLFLMQLATCVFFYTEAKIMPGIQVVLDRVEGGAKDDPIRVHAALAVFSIQELDYLSAHHLELTSGYTIYLLSRYFLTYQGKSGHDELKSYKPLSMMMYMVASHRISFNTLLGKQVTTVIAPDAPPDEPELWFPLDKEYYDCMSPEVRLLMDQVMKLDMRTDRIQLFSENIFRMFLAPGERAASVQDHSIWKTPDNILTLHSDSHSKYVDLCAAAVYLGPRRIFAKPAATGDPPFSRNLYTEPVKGPKRPEDLRLIFCLAVVFALDILCAYRTSGQRLDFLDHTLVFNPDPATLRSAPGTIAFWGRHFFVADVAGQWVRCGDNNPNQVLRQWRKATAHSSEGSKHTMNSFWGTNGG